MGYYLIQDTCPDLYAKAIRKITKQLDKDKVGYTLCEIVTSSAHKVSCNDINKKDCVPRKSKACLSCPYAPEYKSHSADRKNSDKTTIITLK